MTQTMPEGIPSPVLQRPVPFQPSLETILESISSVEHESNQAVTLVVVESQMHKEEKVVQDINDKQPLTTAHFGDEVLEVEEG